MWKKKKVKQIRNSVAIRHNTRAGVCVSTTNTHTHTERDRDSDSDKATSGSWQREASTESRRSRSPNLFKQIMYVDNQQQRAKVLPGSWNYNAHTCICHAPASAPLRLVWVSLALGRVINVSVVVAKCFSIQIWFYLPTLFLPGGRCRPPFPPPSQCLPSLSAAPFLAGRLAMPGQVPLAGYR